jgi:WD40 repeat protein
MNTDGEIQSINNNLKSVNVFFSPQTNRSIYKSENKNAFTREANEVTNNYSPFVIKKSPNLLNSNSSQKSKNFSEINTVQNHKVYTPSPGNILKERLSDRFIPMNKGTNLLEKFELAKSLNGRESIADQEKEIHLHSSSLNGNSTYFNLLESNFFNKHTDHLINEINSKPNKVSKESMTPVKSKIFSFRTEQKKRTNAMFAFTGQLNFETDNESSCNILRKINNRPYKIIEAPGLMDDFYLNLVDWSSKNELAVGLYNSVYLWCANKTQCVKLFNYEEDRDKYVSSVIWNPNGNEVAIGNSEGTLEIWDGILILTFSKSKKIIENYGRS